MDGTEASTAAVSTVLYHSDQIDKIWGSLGFLCGILTIIGNICVFLILMKLPKRSLSDCAFINLSVIDTVAGLAALAGSWFLVDERRWIAGSGVWHTITCYGSGMVWNAASLTTPLLVSVVSIGRLAAVYLPLRYDKVFTPVVVYIMITYCWIHGITASTLSLWGDLGASGEYAIYRGWGFCDQSIMSAYKSSTTSTALYILFFTVPMMLTCSCIVICNLCVMMRIIGMKCIETPEERLRKESSVRLSTSQIVAQRVEKFGRRISTISRASITRYKLSSTSLPTDNTDSNGDSSYRHFEICPVDENEPVPGPRRKLSKSGTRGAQRAKRAKRENRAILMTLLVSVSYLLCYMEIINYYLLASLTDNPTTLFDKILGQIGVVPGGTVRTYVNLWYYYSLFVAAFVNVLLHFMFNRVVRMGLKRKGDTDKFASSIARTRV